MAAIAAGSREGFATGHVVAAGGCRYLCQRTADPAVPGARHGHALTAMAVVAFLTCWLAGRRHAQAIPAHLAAGAGRQAGLHALARGVVAVEVLAITASNGTVSHAQVALAAIVVRAVTGIPAGDARTVQAVQTRVTEVYVIIAGPLAAHAQTQAGIRSA